MNRRLLTILLVAFVIAGVCAFGVYRIVGTKISSQQQSPTTTVVAAATDLKLGTVLTQADLGVIKISGVLPKGAVPEQQRLSLVGRGVVTEMAQGEPILESHLAAAGSGGGLAATIPEGMRACAVKVDDVVGVSGFATPGMRVDVLASGIPPNAPPSSGTVTTTLLQDIQVLSAGTDIQKDAEGKPVQVQVVNLLVTPEQAQTLSLASSQLKIQLVLRNPLDTKVEPVAATATPALFGAVVKPPEPVRVVKRAAPAAPKAKPYSMEIINGSSSSQENFGSSEGQH
ncbi:MAG TPA: Flp pilus assembly protein CpaB [Terracidiphilus sp.]|nr:Flp pilus assembly protein CpaB [Terracidiphilus sp.]